MKKCKKCGEPIPDHAKFCLTCGVKCDDEPEEQTGSGSQEPKIAQDAARRARPAPGGKRKRRKKKKMRLLALALVAVLILAAAVLLLTRGCGEKTTVTTYPAALTDGASATPAYTSQFSETDAASAKIEVPAVVGLTLAQAREQLEKLGFVVDAMAAAYDAAKPGDAVLTQSQEPGAWALSGDHIALTYNALPLTLNVFAFAPREGRITLGNLIETCASLGTTNPTFGFSILIHAAEEYELKGGFRCLTGADEDKPITKVNTQLLREGKLLPDEVSNIAYDDSIGWTIAISDWTGFHFDHVTGYDVTVYSREDTSLAVSRSYAPSETKSITLLDCGFDGGRIRLDVATEKQVVIRLTDDRLNAGYSNSAEPKGDLTPVWEVKLLINSASKWIGATVDGSGGEAMSDMKAFGTRFIKANPKDGSTKASQFDGVSYTVDGDTLVISVTVPDDADFSVYELKQLQLTTGDGAFSFAVNIR